MMMVKVAMMRNLDMLNEHETRRTNQLLAVAGCALLQPKERITDDMAQL